MTASEMDEVIVMEPQGELYEGAECDEMERRLFAQVERGARVVVDVSATRHLSARCLGIFARAHQLATQHGGCVVLCGANRDHRWLLETTGLAEALPFFEDVAAAIRDLRDRRRAVA